MEKEKAGLMGSHRMALPQEITALMTGKLTKCATTCKQDLGNCEAVTPRNLEKKVVVLCTVGSVRPP